MARERETNLTGATSAAELNDGELSQVTAGKTYYGSNTYVLNSGYIYLANRDGSIGFMWDEDTIEYRPCPKCGKPMHEGTMSWYYCDPCNYKAGSPAKATWTGSIEELGAAAATAW